MRPIALLSLFALAACSDPLASPTPWSIHAHASAGEGYCIVNMHAEVTGSVDDFSGRGSLHITTMDGGFRNIDADIVRRGNDVQIADFTMHVRNESPNALSGEWECEAMPGYWTMERR